MIDGRLRIASVHGRLGVVAYRRSERVSKLIFLSWYPRAVSGHPNQCPTVLWRRLDGLDNGTGLNAGIELVSAHPACRRRSTRLLVVPIELGIEAAHEFEVQGELLTDVGGTLGFSVLSTPGMIAMMERTAAMLVYPHLPEGKATVGFEVCIKHVRSASQGSRCVARARLREVRDDRKLLFHIEVVDHAQRTIGIGTHERRMIDAQARTLA